MNMNTYEYRNAIKLQTGTYECEINHPEYGWIPFHATYYDNDSKGLALFNALESDDSIPVEAIEVHIEKQKYRVRYRRDLLLRAHVDPIISNSFRFNSLDEGKKQELLNYRQELLDITLQEGFPLNINFPTKPSWI